MKVAEYLKEGPKNMVEEALDGYNKVGEFKSGCHRVNIMLKVERGKVKDCKFTATKRCKKLLAVADYVCENVKGKSTKSLSISEEDIVSFFGDEKETDKIKNRAEIVLNALNNALNSSGEKKTEKTTTTKAKRGCGTKKKKTC